MPPFIAGIACELYFQTSLFNIYWALALLLLAALLMLIPGDQSLAKRPAIFLADCFFLVSGVLLTRQSGLQQRQTYYANLVSPDSLSTYVAVLNDLPVEKTKFIKCELAVKACRQNTAFKPAEGNVIAYFRKDALVRSLKAGDAVVLTMRLSEPRPPANPYEFDYRIYLANHRVYHTAFVDSGSVKVYQGERQLNPVSYLALRLKNKLIANLKAGGLSADAYAICAALLTGYDAEVDKSVMDAFSHSGTLHVLSVSGLHTGLIYIVLSFLFDLIDRRRRFKLARFIFISALLWCFALVTGFSAPVLRAVIMFNLFGLGKIYFRNDARNQLNILLVSAFILLLWDPYLITDVGFILSYTALAGIICFQPRLAMLWQPDHFLPRYCWQSVTASFSATISTLPVTLFYFKQFPLWFFISNLVVVPLSFVLLLLAMLAAAKLGFVSFFINGLVSFLLYFMGLFNVEGLGYVDGISFYTTDLLFCLLFLLLFSLALSTRKYRHVAASLAVLIAWQLSGFWQSLSAKNERLLTAYHVRKKSIATVKDKSLVYLNVYDSLAHNYSVKPHLVSFNNPELRIGGFNYVNDSVKGLLVLDRPGGWPVCNASGITHLLVANDFELSSAGLERFPALSTVVADASNNAATLRKTAELCRKFGLCFYSTRSSGAFLMQLK